MSYRWLGCRPRRLSRSWYCWPNGDPLIETSAAGLAELEARLA